MRQITKRAFITGTLATAGLATLGGRLALAEQQAEKKEETMAQPAKKEATMSAFTLPDLPYPQDALEPYISAKTFEFHHGKHHNAYVTKLNELLPGSGYEGKALEEIIQASWRDKKSAIFNQSAQVWNHTFFWNSMKPKGGGAPKGELAERIKTDFGSFDKFKEEFKNAGVTQFGSGWAWLVLERGKLKVVKTANAELPMVNDQKALLTADVWEHAYYLDYQNRRPDFLTAFLDHLANWDFAEQNLKA